MCCVIVSFVVCVGVRVVCVYPCCPPPFNSCLVPQELAHALYQHDAACRVIARLIKERDDARLQLGDAQANVAGALAAPAAGSETSGIAAAAKVMTSTAKDLSKSRRKRVKASAAAAMDAATVAGYSCTSTHPLHSASKPGILCVDLSPQDKVIAFF